MEELLRQLGSQNVGLAVLAGVIIYSIRWFASNIAKPLTERHIKFLDTVEANTASTNQAVRNIDSSLDDIRSTQKKHLDVCQGAAHQ